MYNKSTIKLFSLILYYESNVSFCSMHIVKKEDKCKIFMMMCMDYDMNVCEQKSLILDQGNWNICYKIILFFFSNV